MRNLFRGGFHLKQRISVPGGIDMTQQGVWWKMTHLQVDWELCV